MRHVIAVIAAVLVRSHSALFNPEGCTAAYTVTGGMHRMLLQQQQR
jgi:hypothetical protein